MATHTWRGDAPAIAQVDECPVGGTIEIGDEFTLTINGKSVMKAATTTVAATTADEVATAAAASSIPEFAELTWTDDGAKVVATGDAEGVPFTLTVATTESGGGAADSQTFSLSTITAAQSKWHLVADNLSGGSLPSDGDTLIFQDSAVDVRYGLDQSSVTLDLLVFAADFTGEVGLPQVNQEGSSAYFEYRDRYLQIGADEVRIGEGRGQGSPAIRLDLGTAQTLVQVFSTGNSRDPDYGAVQLLAVNAANELRVFNGTVDVAMGPGEVSTFATIRASGGVVRLGSGCTLTTVEANGNSVVEVNSAATTLKTQGNGRIQKLGSGATTNVDVDGGTIEYSAGGTITTLVVRSGKTFDASKLNVAVTITNATAYSGATIRDPNGMITWTNGISCPDGANSVTIETKKGVTVTVT